MTAEYRVAKGLLGCRTFLLRCHSERSEESLRDRKLKRMRDPSSLRSSERQRETFSESHASDLVCGPRLSRNDSERTVISISLRPATEDDLAPMFQVHEAAMRDYVERTWGRWDPAWQWRYFREHFSLSRCQIVLVDSQPAGYFQVAREADHFFIEFIILAPAYHRRAAGTALIQGLLAEANRAKLPVGLQVL